MDPLTTCRTRRFCACPTCQALLFDSDGGAYRGNPQPLAVEQARATAGYTPTHRKVA